MIAFGNKLSWWSTWHQFAKQVNRTPLSVKPLRSASSAGKRRQPSLVSRVLPHYLLCFLSFLFLLCLLEASEVPLLISRLACRSIHMMIGLSFTPNHPWYIRLFFSFFYLKFIMFSGSSSTTLKKCADNVIAPP